MKKKTPAFTKVFLSVLFASFFIAGSLPVFADGEEKRNLSDDERGAISTNCGTIRQSLKSLQRADSRTRVLLGTTYQSLLSEFITPLNLRLTKNNIPDAELVRNQNSFVAARDEFTTSFIKYSRSLEDLIAIDCKAEPDKFYEQLEDVRAERAKVAAAVEKIGETISEHVMRVNDLKIRLEQK